MSAPTDHTIDRTHSARSPISLSPRDEQGFSLADISPAYIADRDFNPLEVKQLLKSKGAWNWFFKKSVSLTMVVTRSEASIEATKPPLNKEGDKVRETKDKVPQHSRLIAKNSRMIHTIHSAIHFFNLVF